jgi:phosphate transport system substrate-binding protein
MNKALILNFLLIIIVGGCTKSYQSTNSCTTLSGIGVAFPFPFQDVVFENYGNETGNRIIGNDGHCGIGIHALRDKVIDFTSSRALLTEEELSEFASEILNIPICLGSVVMTFNLPGLSELNLTGPLIAAIYMEKIHYWDDEAIKAINPEIDLPHTKITIICCADKSGISYVFSDYLCKVSPEWAKETEAGKLLHRHFCIVVSGCLDVPCLIREIDGSIGYISAEYADLLDLPTAAIQNTQGKYIKASKESVWAAADTQYPDDMRIMITNSIHEDAYPLSCFSWILVYKNQLCANKNSEKQEVISSFLNYLISPEVQRIAGNFGYVPLPEEAVEKAKKLINTMNHEL